MTHLRLLVLATVPMLLCATPQASAQTLSWDGGAALDFWSHTQNWNPNAAPGSNNTLSIGVAVDSLLDQDFSILGLDIFFGGNADTNGRFLGVGANGVGIGPGSTLTVSNNTLGNALSTADVNVANAGVLSMNGGSVQVSDFAQIHLGGTLAGFGHLNFNEALTSAEDVLINNGQIGTARPAGSTATQHYTLLLTANDPQARINFGGADAEVSVVENTTLDVDIAQTSIGIVGSLALAAGSTFDLQENWVLRGTIDVNAGSPSAGVAAEATLAGGQVNASVNSRINVNSGKLIFSNRLVGLEGALHVANGAKLQFDGTSTFHGDVNLSHNNELIIRSNTTFTDDDWDWDGANSSALTTIDNGVFTVSGDQISAAGDNAYRGNIQMNGGSLSVRDGITQNGWTFLGRLVSDTTGTNQVSGDTTIGGDIVVQAGTLRFNDDVTATSAADFDVVTGTELYFDRAVTFTGGSSFAGDGDITLDSFNVAVNGIQAINMPNSVVRLDANAADQTYDLNADFTVNASSIGPNNWFGLNASNLIDIDKTTTTFTVNLTDPNDFWRLGNNGRIHISGTGALGTSLAGSDLHVSGEIDVDTSTRFIARVDVNSIGEIDVQTNSVLHLHGGSLADPNTMEGGLISGSGVLASASSGLTGYGSINPDISFTAGSDLIASGGTLNINGNVLNADRVGASSTGTIQFGVSQDTSQFGALELSGGTVTGAALEHQGVIQGYGTIASQEVDFHAGSQTDIPNSTDVLNLDTVSTVFAGSQFGGDGTLSNALGSTMSLSDGSQVGVMLSNAGTLQIEKVGIGSVSILDLTQTATGTLSFQLGGDDFGEYDFMQVDQLATLDGELMVELLSFTPSLGDNFLLMTAGSLAGTFSSTNLPALGSGLDWLVNYTNDDEVVLSVIQGTTISGDFDNDGDYSCLDVDGLVAEIVAGTNNAQFDLTGDGQVDGLDLDAWLAEAGAAELVSGNPYLAADANLDGDVNGQDFDIWNANKFTADNGWCGGDLNADGYTNGHDFLIWNANKFTSADSDAASTVPEPALNKLLAAVLAGAFLRRRTRSTVTDHFESQATAERRIQRAAGLRSRDGQLA